jgi:cysteinyl-tRNA synthetase
MDGDEQEAQSDSEAPAEAMALAAELAGYEGDSPAEAIDALLALRTTARAAKDWSRADAVRDGLTTLGLIIEDTPQGPRVLRK